MVISREVSEAITTRYGKLFGTPERMAQFIVEHCGYDCPACFLRSQDCPCSGYGVDEEDYDTLLKWLKEDA